MAKHKSNRESRRRPRSRSHGKSHSHKSKHKRRRSSTNSGSEDKACKSHRRNSNESLNRRSKHEHGEKPRKISRSRERENSPTSTTFRVLQIAEERRLQELEARKRVREEMKAQETPEEKRARRLKEKEEKEKRRRERMGWDGEYQLYSNEDNPFGDSSLTSTFCWKKKFEKEGLINAPAKAIEAISHQKQLENKRELEKVKKSRALRELERQAREEESMLQQRAKEAAQFREWEQHEDKFHLEQARMRSEIRIRDGRAKPIDLLAQYVSSGSLEEAIEVQMYEPYALLRGLGVDELEDLLVDINVYMTLEHGANNDYWNDMIVIAQDELKKQINQKQQEDEDALCRREGIHNSVLKDVKEIFRGKNTEQLEQIQKRIEQKLLMRDEGIDVSYWDTVLSQLKAHMARSRLRDRHQRILREKLQTLKEEQEQCEREKMHAKEDEQTVTIDRSRTIGESNEFDIKPIEAGESDDKSVDDTIEAVGLYEAGKYSPTYEQNAKDTDNFEIIEDIEDRENLHTQRSRIVNRQAERETQGLSQRERLMHMEARKGMMGDEVEFAEETPIEDAPQMASDKYRPRKPRYFNRVHTGFEWNKYNQTHYDMDNPPPKIVQGYKFNIFYPDLINRSTTPKYYLKPCEDNPDFAVLRFHTGPPYEDIAFKIVNREWEYSYKRGFRCQFHNNIFQLWFHFKRYRYRR